LKIWKTERKWKEQGQLQGTVMHVTIPVSAKKIITMSVLDSHAKDKPTLVFTGDYSPS
jgi:hypothetical protein